MNDKLMNTTLQPKKWKGYTLDELRYRQALMTVAIEIEKDRLRRSVAEVVPNAVRTRTSGANMLSKALGALSYVDYAIMGFKLFKLLGRLRRLRRN